jgi:hypothetical protein
LIKGFKDILTTKYLNDFARKAVDRLPSELRTGAKTGAPGFGPAAYIDYPINTRVAPIKDALIGLNLTHKDENGEVHALRISSDLPLAVRHKGRVLGELWKLVEPFLSGLPAAVKPQNFQLGNSNGKLFLVLERRPVELFVTSVDDTGTMHVTPPLGQPEQVPDQRGHGPVLGFVCRPLRCPLWAMSGYALCISAFPLVCG